MHRPRKEREGETDEREIATKGTCVREDEGVAGRASSLRERSLGQQQYAKFIGMEGKEGNIHSNLF